MFRQKVQLNHLGQMSFSFQEVELLCSGNQCHPMSSSHTVFNIAQMVRNQLHQTSECFAARFTPYIHNVFCFILL